MRSSFRATTLLCLSFFGANVLAQSGATDPAASTDKKYHYEMPTVAPGKVSADPDIPLTNTRNTVSDDDSSVSRRSVPILLPRHNRFKSFLNDSFGPDTLLFEATGAGITTRRNAPKEWGDDADGFARRFSSNLGKNLIKQSVTYGLDEALKVDSTFYRSRDRSTAARFRNSVFSAVTARKRNGKRVIGISKIAGSVVGNVAAAELWYPNRYNYVHGLKGAGITLAFDALHNVFREFVWKK